MTKREQAIAYFKEGYNCAQAVFLTFCNETGTDKKQAARISAPFGGGFGRQREVCGAVSGMCMVLGVLYGCDNPADSGAKLAHYAAVQEVCQQFRERCGGSIICRELIANDGKDTSPKPSARTDEYYKKRPCAEIVGEAADIMENWLREHPIA